MIGKYFLSKDNFNTTPTHCYLMSWDNKHHFTDLSLVERLAVHRLYCEMLNKPEDKPDAARPKRAAETEIESTEPQAAKKKRVQTAKEVSIKETVDALVNLRCVTVEDWMFKDPDSYVRVLAMPGGESLCKNILEIAALHVSKNYTAFDLLHEQAEDDSWEYNLSKLWQIFSHNQYNPIKVFHAIMCVLNKQSGKRNTILFHGPATTGKSLIAQQICQEIGNVGCYNPANVNFPFNDCTNKNVIWVEECSNFGQQVNQFKAVCSGQAIRVDQKGKGSKPLYCTPVVMTTNEDITRVIIGCEDRPEHTEPIKQRMVDVPLNNPLPGDFGLLEKGCVSNACKWMVDRGYEPTMASYLQHWGSLPVWGENWAEPTMSIKPPSDAQPMFSPPHAEETIQAISDLVKALEADLAQEQASDEQPVSLQISRGSNSENPQQTVSSSSRSSTSIRGRPELPKLVAYSSDSTETSPPEVVPESSLSVSHA